MILNIITIIGMLVICIAFGYMIALIFIHVREILSLRRIKKDRHERDTEVATHAARRLAESLDKQLIKTILKRKFKSHTVNRLDAQKVKQDPTWHYNDIR